MTCVSALEKLLLVCCGVLNWKTLRYSLAENSPQDCFLIARLQVPSIAACLVRVTGLECYKLCFTIFHNIAILYISSRFLCIFISIRFTLFQIGKEQIKNTNQAQAAPKKRQPPITSLTERLKFFGLDVLYQFHLSFHSN